MNGRSNDIEPVSYLSRLGFKPNHPGIHVGFCFGGRISFNQAASGLDLAGVIGFYGRVVEEEPGDLSAPLNLVNAYRCPVLGFFGGADPKITPEHAAAFRRALEAAGVDNEIVVYDDAPHSFFELLPRPIGGTGDRNPIGADTPRALLCLPHGFDDPVSMTANARGADGGDAMWEVLRFFALFAVSHSGQP